MLCDADRVKICKWHQLTGEGARDVYASKKATLFHKKIHFFSQKWVEVTLALYLVVCICDESSTKVKEEPFVLNNYPVF